MNQLYTKDLYYTEKATLVQIPSVGGLVSVHRLK